MGHTHHAREYIIDEKTHRKYLNTGTWIDQIRVPHDALIADLAGYKRLADFLRNLFNEEQRIRCLIPCWAEIRIQEDGSIEYAKLVEGTPIYGV